MSDGARNGSLLGPLMWVRPLDAPPPSGRVLWRAKASDVDVRRETYVMPFTHRVAVSWSSRGIGHALAHALRLPARVVLADIESGADVRLADGTLARFVRTDVGSESDVQALIDGVLASEGQIDLFASNAGISIEIEASAAEADWQRVVVINQMSHVWVARHVLPAMLARGISGRRFAPLMPRVRRLVLSDIAQERNPCHSR
jgi:NAD(P)-dependent dehydrogenase (short-subunit alcohol dehydrogenase family)